MLAPQLQAQEEGHENESNGNNQSGGRGEGRAEPGGPAEVRGNMEVIGREGNAHGAELDKAPGGSKSNTGVGSSVSKLTTVAKPTPPSKFELNYPLQPEPGLRKWTRSGENWFETYPSGHKTHFQTVKRFTLKGVSGTIISPEKEAGFQVFIPDENADDKAVYFRHGTSDWEPLGLLAVK